jgi:hypothetical protein
LLRALWPTCPKAAVAQRKHKTRIVVFIMILFWGNALLLNSAVSCVKELVERCAKGNALEGNQGNCPSKPRRPTFELEVLPGWVRERVCTYREKCGKVKPASGLLLDLQGFGRGCIVLRREVARA